MRCICIEFYCDFVNENLLHTDGNRTNKRIHAIKLCEKSNK